MKLSIKQRLWNYANIMKICKKTSVNFMKLSIKHRLLNFANFMELNKSVQISWFLCAFLKFEKLHSFCIFAWNWQNFIVLSYYQVWNIYKVGKNSQFGIISQSRQNFSRRKETMYLLSGEIQHPAEQKKENL